MSSVAADASRLDENSGATLHSATQRASGWVPDDSSEPRATVSVPSSPVRPDSAPVQNVGSSLPGLGGDALGSGAALSPAAEEVPEGVGSGVMASGAASGPQRGVGAGAECAPDGSESVSTGTRSGTKSRKDRKNR